MQTAHGKVARLDQIETKISGLNGLFSCRNRQITCSKENFYPVTALLFRKSGEDGHQCQGKGRDLFSGIRAHEFGKDKEDKHAGEEQRDRGKGKDR